MTGFTQELIRRAADAIKAAPFDGNVWECQAQAALEASGIAELTEALTPFAKAADETERAFSRPAELPDGLYCGLSLGDCRRARDVLAKIGCSQ